MAGADASGGTTSSGVAEVSGSTAVEATTSTGAAGTPTTGVDPVCSQPKVRLSAGDVVVANGLLIPVLVDVSTADLSQLPTSAAASPQADATAAAAAVYRARVGTVATVAGLSAARVATVQDRIVLNAVLVPGDDRWRFSGQVILFVDSPQRACDLGALPEVAAVASALGLIEPTVPAGS